MANLRLTRIRVNANNAVRAEFSASLDTLINTSNIDVEPILSSLPKPEVLDLLVKEDLLYITTNYLTPYASYKITFQSSQTQRFRSESGNEFLLEDGKNNIAFIQGLAQDNTITDTLKQYLKDNIYNLDGTNLVSKTIESQGEFLSKALRDIGQLANDNYLDNTVENEKHIRGTGPFDRLNQEGAFEILRVGLNESNYSNSLRFNYDSFPLDRITLQRTVVINEQLIAGTGPGTFDGLTLTVNHSPTTKLSSVEIHYYNGTVVDYDIEQYGYQILNSVYDTDYASTYLLLENNQFKLSDDILDIIDPLVAGDTIIIEYEYKSLGREISEDTVVVSEVIPVLREVAPAIITEFSLDYAPVVTTLDNIPDSGGVDFLNPRSVVPFSQTHPAFLNEITFKMEGLPSNPGDYAIDYENGRVFVYGATTNDGTGVFPPVMNYNYRKVYRNNLDYTYNPELMEVVANPLRDLAEREITISFDYEEVFVPGTDYNGNVHVEELDERIDNRLDSLTSLHTEHYPITNVFRLYNETTGERYVVNRFSDTAIYFSANQYPRIFDITRERATFFDVLNETLLVSSETTNVSLVRIFTIELLNDTIISSTEDVIGSSFNTSVQFSRNDIFINELYFDGQTYTVPQNINKLTVGDYLVDYINGIVYVGVSVAQTFDLGTINYKKAAITTENKHIISVSEVYHSLNPNAGVSITLDYSSFTDTEIIPNTFGRSDERFLNEDTTLPYVCVADNITVSDNPKDVRGIFDLYDLNNNADPINFATGSTISGNIITIDSAGYNIQEICAVSAGNEVNLTFISDGISVVSVSSVLRISDGVELWDSSGTIVDYVLTLSGIGAPVVGDIVSVNYNVNLNGGSTPVVDYNRGDYFVDYSYLADEILVSYEWGDNSIDFRESTSIDEGTEYYVSYRVGALRDALLANFGTLVDLPIMQSFDTSLPRENYRDALKGALQSFPQGPTIPSIKNLVKNITKVDPEIIESIFDIWTLGISTLYNNQINYTGEPELVVGKFDYGILINEPDQTISFPISDNIRISEGTMEMFVIPEWDGLDNDATLTFVNLMLDGYAVSSNNIYIGSGSHHPTITNGSFTVNRLDDLSPVGVPSAIYLSNSGVFIYYDDTTKRWNFLAKDITTVSHEYSGKVFTSGEFYDVKFIQDLGESGDILRSITNEIKFEWNLGNDVSYDGYTTGDGYVDGYSFDGITFMSDDSHYLFDMAEPVEVPTGLIGTITSRREHPAEISARRTKAKNRMSIYKDGKGYLNFEVFDSNYRLYKVSADISSWQSGQTHLVSTAWKIDTYDRADELHLFIDGVEVPNILKYGGRPIVATGDRFRIVKPEIVVGTISNQIFRGDDLQTVAGTYTVYSPTINFAIDGVVPGNTISILELGFVDANITIVSGHTLTLDQPSYTTLNDARYSINPFSAVVSDEVNLSANIAVSLYDGYVETEIAGQRANFPAYRVYKNALLQTVLQLYGPADIGDQIYIRTLGINHRRCRDNVYLWGSSSDGYVSIIKTQMPPPINLDEVDVYSIILPLYDGYASSSPAVISGIVPTAVSNTVEGRRLAVRITSDNVDFTTPVQVVITGTSSGGATETLAFTSATTITTTYWWMTISDITITVVPVIINKYTTSIEVKEAYSLTDPDGNNAFPIIRFTFQEKSGNNLASADGTIVSGGHFIDTDVGNYIVISSPLSVAGTYTIDEVYVDGTILLDPVPGVVFTSGVFKVYNATIGRSGFQNGFFMFELAGSIGTPYDLPQGRYEFDYAAWLEIPFTNVDGHMGYIGSDFNGTNQAKAVIDEFKVLSTMLTDIRIGETAAATEDTITTDFNTLRAFRPDQNTLMLLHFDDLLFTNEASIYKMFYKEYLQSSASLNEYFNQSLVITERPFVIDNNGYLSTKSEGTIEFWISPRFDTYNDPVERYYFDATSSVIEEIVSLTPTTIKTAGRINQVLSVRLLTDVNEIGKEYYAGGSIANDYMTVHLGTALPSARTPVKISYISSGFNGDRISIFKDRYGYVNFRVYADNNVFEVRQPIFWQRDTWHRICATFKFNRRDNLDELRMFVDGREQASIRFGQGFVFGSGIVFGEGASIDSSKLIANIDFLDMVNKLYIGSTYRSYSLAAARFDNLKISNIARAPLVSAGVPIDENYQSNIDIVRPVVEDLYTLYLMNFDQIFAENEDFAILRDEQYGIFSFILNVIDSFDIVSGSAKINQILRELILTLKPAHAKATINIIE